MAKVKQILIALAVLSSFVFILGKAQASTASQTDNVLKPPTLIAPNKSTITAKPRPLITGLVKSGATVLFYIDGVYYGKLDKIQNKSGTANFAYKPFLNLSVGNHTAWSIAQDTKGNKTGTSNTLFFKIEHPFPAPTMFKAVVNYKSTKARPFIVGLAKNDSKIKVFIDKKLAGEFQVKNDVSGTANFAFRPKTGLARGTHLIYTTATDVRGKESSWSNLTWYKASAPAISMGAEEKSKVLKQVKGETQNNAQEGNQKNGKQGLVDESRHNQSAITGNLIIFIIFLIGVIAWVFWINRELVKEKKADKPAEPVQIVPKPKETTVQTAATKQIIHMPPPKNTETKDKTKI